MSLKKSFSKDKQTCKVTFTVSKADKLIFFNEIQLQNILFIDSTFSVLQTRVYFFQKSLYALILLVWYRFHRARALIDIHQLFVHTSGSQNGA